MEDNKKRKELYNGQSDILKGILGEGDSFYIASFVPNAEKIFSSLKEEVTFLSRDAITFSIFGKRMSLPRDKQLYGDVEEDGTFPLFRYGDKYVPDVHPWVPSIEYLRNLVNNKLGFCCNHAVINQYKNGEDHIGFHKDKTRDFTKGTSVITISLGIARCFQLKNVKSGHVQEIVLQPGSLFVLGTKTNEEWKHSIPKRSVNEIKDIRISVTLRNIATRYNPKTKEIFEGKDDKKKETVLPELTKREREDDNDDKEDTITRHTKSSKTGPTL